MLNDAIKHFYIVVICVVVLVGVMNVVSGQQIQIPSWIKNNAKWWYEGKIADSDFTKGIQYLIQNKMMMVPTANSIITKENKIPAWVKNDAGWWANGTISDSEFVAGIKFLLNAGIIYINSEQNYTINNQESPCDNLSTAAEKETCLQQTEYDTKIKNSITSATPYYVGPVTFYYVGNELQAADDGKSILTVHFVVEDDSNQEITMSCARQDSCDYALSDGQREIPYATNTLVYGSLTLTPKTPKFVDWTFYNIFDPTKNYSFLVKESWGTGSIPVKIQ